MVASSAGAPGGEDLARLDTALRRRFPWLTLTLGAVCVLLFVLGQAWSDGNFSLVLYRMGANSGEAVRAGELWRLVASMFLHADAGHIAVNPFLESERQAMQTTPLAEAQRHGDPRIVTVGAHRFAFTTDAFKNGVEVRTWASALGDREVVLRIFSPAHVPSSWAGIEDQIVESLQRQ